MKKYLLLLLAFTILVSCRREQAFFQKSSLVTYEKSPKKTVVQPIEEPLVMASLNNEPDFLTETPQEVQSIEAVLPEIAETTALNSPTTKFSGGEGRKTVKLTRKIFRLNRKLNNAVDRADEKLFSKKRRNDGPFDRINAGIKIGVVFLLLAILLSLIGVKQIALIFAIASIVSLFFGLRKAFR